MINYVISLDEYKFHNILVELTVDERLYSGQEFWISDWIPGSYMIRDFSRNITEISASENGRLISLSKINKSRWVLNENVDSLVIKYKIYAWDLSVRSAHFDEQHCFFNGTSVFLGVDGMEDHLHEVEITINHHAKANKWKVATGMDIQKVDNEGFGKYYAPNYAVLIDCPFEISNFIECQFEVFNTPHKMVFTEAPNEIDWQRITEDVKTICEYECRFFSTKPAELTAKTSPPFESYLFMTFVQKNGFGGLEHMNSTALHCSVKDLPSLHDDKNVKSKNYQKFLSLCSHEYFHSWNVKRVKPALFREYELQQEINTELLWFFEGITSYYDELFLLRSGVIDKNQYLDMLGKNITRYIRGNGRLKQSIAESSFDAWTKFYKQDENAPNAITSYYVKGGLIAFLLDFELRKMSNQKVTLDDLMRLVWTKYGMTGIGVNEKDIQKEVEHLVGGSIKMFLESLIYTTDDLNLNELLKSLGICLQVIPEVKHLESGGFSKERITRKNVCSLNISHKSHPMGAEIQTVFEQGGGAKLGLSNKDVIIAINDYHINSKELDEKIASYAEGAIIKISYFRRDRLYHKDCRLSVSQVNVCYLSFIDGKPNSKFNSWAEQE